MAISPDGEQRARLERLFPLLSRTPFAIRASASGRYNCIAWAMGSQTEWWWPDQRSFWPVEPRLMSLDGFIRAFKAMGFEPCAGPEFEDTYTKIALYLLNGRPTHAARIESNVLWTSKLGRAEFIEHAPTGLNGTTYGRPLHFFRKKTQNRL